MARLTSWVASLSLWNWCRSWLSLSPIFLLFSCSSLSRCVNSSISSSIFCFSCKNRHLCGQVAALLYLHLQPDRRPVLWTTHLQSRDTAAPTPSPRQDCVCAFLSSCQSCPACGQGAFIRTGSSPVSMRSSCLAPPLVYRSQPRWAGNSQSFSQGTRWWAVRGARGVASQHKTGTEVKSTVSAW